MGEITVFKWAHVLLDDNYLILLEKEGKNKQDVFSHLSKHTGVSAVWDENGYVKLEGKWSHLIKAQLTLQGYVSSACVKDTAEHKQQIYRKDSNHSLDSTCEVTRSSSSKQLNSVLDFKKCELNCDNTIFPKAKVHTGNEVYVNITLSVPPIKSLNHKDNDKSNICFEDKECNMNVTVPKEYCEIESSNDKYVEAPETQAKCIDSVDSVTAGNALQLSCFSLLDKEACHDNNKEGTGSTKSSTNISSSEMSSIENNVSSTEKAISLGNIPFEHTLKTNDKYAEINKEQKYIDEEKPSWPSQTTDMTANSDYVVRVKQKYIKKIDYEELAPFKYFCSICSFKSKRESHFKRHIKLHNEISDIFKCSKCSFTSIRLSHLRRHEFTHNVQKLTCTSCPYTTSSQKLLTRHKRMKHSISQNSETLKILNCTHCDYNTTRNSFLERHLKSHLRESSGKVLIYECKECTYKTNRKEHLIRHTNNIHKGQRPFLCDHCGKAFKRQDALKQHVTIHITEATILCPECGKSCRSQAQLSQHMSVHRSDRSFLCELCGAAFKTRAVQRKHLHTIHQYPKAYFCGHCSRKFNTKFALKRHIRQHSIEKKSKVDDQEKKENPQTVLVAENCNAVRILSTDTLLLHEPSTVPANEQVKETHFPQGSEKITVRLVESCDADTLHIIPTHSIVPQASETTALYYLTGTFTSC